MCMFGHHDYVRDKFVGYRKNKMRVTTEQVELDVPMYRYICLKCGKAKIK